MAPIHAKLKWMDPSMECSAARPSDKARKVANSTLDISPEAIRNWPCLILPRPWIDLIETVVRRNRSAIAADLAGHQLSAISAAAMTSAEKAMGTEPPQVSQAADRLFNNERHHRREQPVDEVNDSP